MLLHAWVTVYADLHYSQVDTEAAIELEPSRGRGRRARGRRLAADPAEVTGPAEITGPAGNTRSRARRNGATAGVAAQT